MKAVDAVYRRIVQKSRTRVGSNLVQSIVCGSRQSFSDELLVARIGFGTDENGSSKVFLPPGGRTRFLLKFQEIVSGCMRRG